MEETEMQRLEVTPTTKRSRSSQASIDGSSSELTYTSLKDILQQLDRSPTSIYGGGAVAGGGRAPIHEAYAFNSSAIGIRNRLVKHAASAYLQSAAILATRNQNCLTRLWRRLQRRYVSTSSHGCMRDPFEVCVGFMARSVRRALACIAGYVGGVRSWAGTIP